MIAENLEILQGKIKKACQRAGRVSEDVRVVLVTKTVPPDVILEAYQLGCRDFGENRVQEWLEKKDKLPGDIRWHMIGHLQTNKVKYCAGQFQLIHSIDSLKLARAVEKEAAEKNVTVECLAQINTSGETSKFGASLNEAEKLVEEILKLTHLKLKGLMTVGPLTEDLEKTRGAFRRLRDLFDAIRKQFPRSDLVYLSMGMSPDFEIAIEEGANLIRIGTAVFGERQKT